MKFSGQNGAGQSAQRARAWTDREYRDDALVHTGGTGERGAPSGGLGYHPVSREQGADVLGHLIGQSGIEQHGGRFGHHRDRLARFRWRQPRTVLGGHGGDHHDPVRSKGNCGTQRGVEAHPTIDVPAARRCWTIHPHRREPQRDGSRSKHVFAGDDPGGDINGSVRVGNRSSGQSSAIDEHAGACSIWAGVGAERRFGRRNSGGGDTDCGHGAVMDVAGQCRGVEHGGSGSDQR